jgi:hypothetical protein
MKFEALYYTVLAEERFVGERNKDEVEIVFLYVFGDRAQ